MSPVHFDRTNKPRITRGTGTRAVVQVGKVGPRGPAGPAGGAEAWVQETVETGRLSEGALSATFASTGPTDPGLSLSPGTEYVWMQTDGSGNLVDILSGVSE